MKNQIIIEKVPRHIAIIMDGNGRWAQKKGNKRIFGHTNAVAAVKETIEGCIDLNIQYLTLYAFSTENWKRPKEEVEALMTLLVSTIEKEKDLLKKNNVQLTTIGDFDKLPRHVIKSLKETMKYTSENNGLTLNLALSYSGRWEMTEAIKRIVEQAKKQDLQAGQIDESFISSFMQTAQMPDPELLIRTSGEYRISNFLLWQIAYTELYFTDILWPDFRKQHLFEAIIDFQKRERRFGKTSEQLTT